MTARHLRMAYRDIPTMTCRAGCSDCCGPVPWNDAELARVAADVPIHAKEINLRGGIRVLQDQITGGCPFVRRDGAANSCAVYERRPFMCRLFGTAPADAGLRCPHGCAPARALTPAAAAALTHKHRRSP